MARLGRPLFPMQEKILRLIAACEAPFDGPLIVESLLKNRELWFAADFTDGLILIADRKDGHALSPKEVVARSQPRPREIAAAAAHFELGEHFHRSGRIEAAQGHWREAHRLQPENWTYKRQAWNLVSPVVQGPTDVYESCWIDDVKKIGAANYYPQVVP